MTIDVLYVTWNRQAFVEFTFEQLLRNTDWSLVERLVVWDDYSQDGSLDWIRARLDRWLDENGGEFPVEVEIRVGGYRSPVEIMRRYVEQYESDLFAKIDNDVVVPPGWLNDMAAVMDDWPTLELLGMQAGMTFTRGLDPRPGGTENHEFQEARHIGGVGLMRREAFTSRRKLEAHGTYFGFTGWQEKYDVAAGWITPDLHVCTLDLIPFEPWASLSAQYVRDGWQRIVSDPYPDNAYYWEWWP